MIGRLAGAPVIVTPSWFVAAAVLTVVFAPTVRRFAPGLATGGVLVVAFAFVLLLFASVFCHEAAHAFVARSRGHRVTELAMTLWGGHTAYTGTQRRPLDGVLVAVVGPVTNLVLAGGFWLAFQATPTASVPALLLYAAFFSNVFVGVFNLLPGLPLDGGQILEAFVWKATGSRRRGTIAAGWIGRVVAVGVLAWALVLPVLRGSAPSVTTVIWSAVVGAFLWQGAGDAMTAARRREIVDALVVGPLAGRAVAVATGTSLADAARIVSGVPDASLVVVDTAGAPLGWVDPAAAATVPPAVAGTTPVDAAVVPFPPGSAVEASLAGSSLLEHLAATSAGARVVPVVEHGRVTGVLDVARVAAALRPS
ncbi:peptidase M50 [Xylanimonas cellulosilytica DSM 15894]|uniref:Zinc metalloprotease n=1 Tax=Xylanimonas cellulosilytica (strain DSM 15894 / JCM 12276 / CECT 5975 / KCTC 9989 / LMG 20990 / NBRC 107835 / XIL07) TaxID=446471 RepID=D1BS21_XYLCX|nr:peptidase M50 [Xylanimonas cellulosilytica DSM 15894]